MKQSVRSRFLAHIDSHKKMQPFLGEHWIIMKFTILMKFQSTGIKNHIIWLIICPAHTAKCK